MKVAVIGLGYVGTVTAACVASHGHDVWGVDVDPAKVDELLRRIARLVGRGSGLGLSLVAAVARLHGAHIEMIDNAPGLQIQLQFPPPTKSDLENCATPTLPRLEV